MNGGKQKIIELGPYKLDVDVEKTRTTNSLLMTTNLRCECDVCQNFTPSISKTDSLVLDFLERIGLDPKNASEVMQYGPVVDGEMWCGGFYHIVGKIIELTVPEWIYTDMKIKILNTEAQIIVLENFKVGFTNDCSFVPEGFPEPYFQLDFSARLPWVMDYLPEDDQSQKVSSAE